MGLSDKFDAALYELRATEKDALLDESQNLDKDIPENSLLQRSVNKLNKQIEKSTTWKERFFLEKQLLELKKINELYKKTDIEKFTNTTRLQIKELITWITEQINFDKNNIDDDYLLLKKIIKTENNKLKDTLDIISPNTIRDVIENNIDIKGIRESIPNEEYQIFFDILTKNYINFLENNLNRKLNKKEEEYLVKNEWLYLNKKEAQEFIIQLINNLKNINLNFEISINLNKWKYKQTVTINIEKYKKSLEENERIKQENTHIQILKEQEKNRVKHFEENMKWLSTKERMNYIENIMDYEEFRPYFMSVINKMQWKTIYLNKNKQVKLSEDYINEHSEELLSNLKTLISLIIEIESNWFSKAQNPISSAEWLWQWLSWNWRMTTEYMYNKKWSSKLKYNETPSAKRKVWLTSSFETTLKNIKRKYPEELLKQLDFIPNKFNKKINITPMDLNLREQIKLLILDLGSNWKQVKNSSWNFIWIKDYLWTAILWNKWAIKEIYKIFHHTRPNKNTIKRLNDIMNKYKNKLVEIN